MRKVIHWELCKRLKCDHTINWYGYKLESVQENETHKIRRDFDIQTDHVIRPRRSDLELSNLKKNKAYCLVDFAVSVGHRLKMKESKKIDKYLDLARELKMLWKMRMTVIPIIDELVGKFTKCLERGIDKLEIRARIEIN